MKLQIAFTHHTIQLNTVITAPDGERHRRDFMNLLDASFETTHQQHLHSLNIVCRIYTIRTAQQKAEITMDMPALPATVPELDVAIEKTHARIIEVFEHGKKIRAIDDVQYGFVRKKLIELEAHLRDLYDERDALTREE